MYIDYIIVLKLKFLHMLQAFGDVVEVEFIRGPLLPTNPVRVVHILIGQLICIISVIDLLVHAFLFLQKFLAFVILFKNFEIS